MADLGPRVVNGAVGERVTTTLKNDVTVTIRYVRVDDRDRFVRAFRKLDRETVYMRFFRYVDTLTDAQLERATHPDPGREVSLVVTIGTGEDEAIVAGGRYVAAAAGARTAEVAFMVEQDYQGLGIASRLLQRLAEIARRHDICRFEAEVLAGNVPMLGVFARSGLPMTQRYEGSVVHVELALDA